MAIHFPTKGNVTLFLNGDDDGGRSIKSRRGAVHTSGFPHRRITRLITQHDSGPVPADKSDLLHRLGQSLPRTDAFANPLARHFSL